MNEKLVIDLETQKTFDEVGGHHNAHKLGISLVGVYSYNRNHYESFREQELDELKQWITDTELVVGFNSKRFDFAVLQPYFRDIDLSTVPHLDIMEEIIYALGHRVKLETIAQATLNIGKVGHGLDAVQYFKAGDWKSLEEYCLADVRVTKEIYDYGMAHGYIWYTNNGIREKIIVRWSHGDTVEDIINRAITRGLQIEIDYMDNDGATSTVRIDVQRFDGATVVAYCHRNKKIRIFDLTKIKKARESGAMESFQKTLL